MKAGLPVVAAGCAISLASLIAFWPDTPRRGPDTTYKATPHVIAWVGPAPAPPGANRAGELRFNSSQVDPPPAASPPPLLKGVLGQGRDRRLYLHVGSGRVTARVGDVVAGWTVTRATATGATVRRGEERAELRLFANPATNAEGPSSRLHSPTNDVEAAPDGSS